MTTILRKYHSVARCTLLGEIIEDTARRYYYRPHDGAELTLVDNRQPSTSRHARRVLTGLPANNAAAPSGPTRDDIDPRRPRPRSSSANRLVARRLVSRPDLRDSLKIELGLGQPVAPRRGRFSRHPCAILELAGAGAGPDYFTTARSDRLLYFREVRS